MALGPMRPTTVIIHRIMLRNIASPSPFNCFSCCCQRQVRPVQLVNSSRHSSSQSSDESKPSSSSAEAKSANDDDKELETTEAVDLKQFEHIFGPPLTEQWTQEELAAKEKAVQANAWQPIYRHTGMFKFFLLIRLQQAVVATTSCFLLYKCGEGLVKHGVIDLAEIWPQANLLIMAILVNRLIKNYFPRVVGVISVDRGTRSIYRIGLFKRGFTLGPMRRSEFARVGDFRPVGESHLSLGRGKYAKMERTFGSKNDFLIMPLRQCQILDQPTATAFLGSLKYFKDVQLDEGRVRMPALEAANVPKAIEEGKEEEKQEKVPKMYSSESLRRPEEGR